MRGARERQDRHATRQSGNISPPAGGRAQARARESTPSRPLRMRRGVRLALPAGMHGPFLGLLSEQYDPVAKRLVGNFPQAFSHVGVINTARNLSRRGGPAQSRGEER